MASGDHYTCDVEIEYLGVQCHNVYCYQQTSGSGGAQDLSLMFDFPTYGVVDATGGLIASVAAIPNCSILNLDDPGDYYSFDPGVVGSAAGDPMPAFVALKFKLVRTTRAVRHGWKRLPGVVETMTTNGVWNGSADAGKNAYMAAVILTLSDNNGNTWLPRLLRKAHSMKNGGPATNEYFPIAAIEFKGISTQNSRKT